MRDRSVKVVIWGLGAMGSGMAKMLLKKKGFKICGVCDSNPNYVGLSLGEVLNLNHQGTIIQGNIEDVVGMGTCDVVLLATDSYTRSAYPKIKWLLEHKVNVISTAEEMAFPYANEPVLALQLDKLAKENGVTVLGTGVNPGMMMDLLILFLTGVCEDINHIDVTRVNSLSPFGKTVMEEQGVGLTEDEFYQKKDMGEIAGHVGFKESIGMISAGLGIEIENFKQEMSPIITKVDRKSEYGFAEAANVVGVDMSCSGNYKSQEFISMRHPQQIEPHLGGVNTGDFIKITGKPNINMSITPEVNGGVGTIAICVNMIPHVINATPGLKTMMDLPVPRAIMGDVRLLVDD